MIWASHNSDKMKAFQQIYLGRALKVPSLLYSSVELTFLELHTFGPHSIPWVIDRLFLHDWLVKFTDQKFVLIINSFIYELFPSNIKLRKFQIVIWYGIMYLYEISSIFI